jgi:hypothetical protein
MKCKTTLPALKKNLGKFFKKMEEGISVGYKKYGDEGLFGDSQLEMIKEELRDNAVYSFLTWHKIDMLQKKLVKMYQLKEFTGSTSKNKFGRKK